MNEDFSLAGKRVLVMGLGVFGGGVATAKWLLKQHAVVTVTDIQKEDELAVSLKKFTKRERENITFVLGRHRKTDFKKTDIIVVNPGVPRDNEYLRVAKDSGAKFENVASLFFRTLKNPSIGITGTRGKSTTTSFIAQLLSKKYGDEKPIGSSDIPLLGELPALGKDPEHPVAVELSSWQLELLPSARRAPHIAVITNLYRDHQNRYKRLRDYAGAKANIFKYQNEDDFLILNAQNDWTKFFLKKKPKSSVLYFSRKPLPKKKDGIYISKVGTIFTRIEGKKTKMFEIADFEKKYGTHIVENLLTAILAVKLFDPELSVTKADCMSLEEIPFRQENILERKGLKVINDTAATSPDAVLSALERFSRQVDKKSELILISGGTDKGLQFDELAAKIKNTVTKQNLILLDGSGTKKMLKALVGQSFFRRSQKDTFYLYDTLEDCVSIAAHLVKDKENAVVLFSPGTSSFEKFKNEFDRGEQFNALVKKYFMR